LGASNDRPHAKQRTTLDDNVAKQHDKLLLALRRGQKVRRPEDIDEFFDQKYIRKKFRTAAHKIVWDI